MPQPTASISLPQASVRLRKGRHATLDRIYRGDLEGWQDEFGRWHVSVESVDALLSREAEAESMTTAA